MRAWFMMGQVEDKDICLMGQKAAFIHLIETKRVGANVLRKQMSRVG